jgi:hypothetical protein
MNAEPNRCAWLLPPGPPRLARGEIHRWLLSLSSGAASLSRMLATLDHDEKACALHFRLLKDHSNFLAARGIFGDPLGQYLGQNPSKLHDRSRRETFRNARPNGA